jgi:glycosyltransferase involved in cell wall biosynthesis
VRVAQISLDGNLPRYGIGQAVVRLCRALADGGDDVHLLCRPEGAAALPARRSLRVTPLVRRGGLLGGRGAYVRQVRRALSGGVDVVHVHAAARMAHWLLPPRARHGAPLVVTCHASDELGPAATAAGGEPGRRARRHARQVDEVLARADVVTAGSRWMAGVVRTRAGGRDVEIVPLGPSSDVASGPSVPHEGFVVLALARFVSIKGLDLLLRAFAAAFRGDPTARLVLAGDGPERAALEALAASLGLAGRVSMPGYLEGEARERALASADVVAVPTLSGYETFGLAALDAGAHGLPIVAVEGGALVERLEGGTGIGVPLGAPEEVCAGLARALAALRADPALRARCGAAGREAARAHAWPRVAARFRLCYEEAIRNASKGTVRGGDGARGGVGTR